MSPEAWLLSGTLVTAAAGLVGTWLLMRQQRRQTRTTDSQQFIDQLQEERAADRLELGELKAQLADLQRRVRDMEAREWALLDYVWRLRWHIEQGKPPPPPEWPTALTARQDQPR